MSKFSPIVVVLIGSLTAYAGPREEEAKEYAANLKHKDAKVRLTAVKELGKLGQLQRRLTTPYISDLMKVLSDPNADVRGAAAETLGLIDPEDKKAIVTKIADLLKNEKSETARMGQEMGLGALGGTAEDSDVKQMARQALLAARKKTESKREQKVIQAAMILITGPKKKN